VRSSSSGGAALTFLQAGGVIGHGLLVCHQQHTISLSLSLSLSLVIYNTVTGERRERLVGRRQTAASADTAGTVDDASGSHLQAARV
jgi:hypothetical protein